MRMPSGITTPQYKYHVDAFNPYNIVRAELPVAFEAAGNKLQFTGPVGNTVDPFDTEIGMLDVVAFVTYI